MKRNPPTTRPVVHNRGAGGQVFNIGPITIQAPGGDPNQMSRQFADALERELARRFRVQTNSYTGRGNM